MRDPKFIFAFFLLVILSSKSTLFANQSDILYINGEKFYINNRFLLHNKIQNYISENNFNKYTIFHSNYYTAEFEVIENRLYLKEIIIYPTGNDNDNFNLSKCDESMLNKLQNIESSTVLIASKIQSDLLTVDSTKNEFIIIEIKNNTITKMYDLENIQEFSKFRCEQFLKYKLTDHYKKDYYYSLKAIESSREKFNYEDENLPIEEEVNNFIEFLFFKSENYSSIL